MKLSVEGDSVGRVCFDYGLVLLTSSGNEFRIETSSTIETAGRSAVSFEPEAPSEIAPALLKLLHCRISRATASDSGTLRLDFDDSVRLMTEPHRDYEAWEMSGARGERIVCGVGGGLVVWSPEQR